MRQRSILLALGMAALTAASAACSLLYSSYGSRFASGPGVEEDAGIGAVTVTTSSVYYAVGGRILSVGLDGGGRSAVWTSDGGQGVLALASNGLDRLAWSYGAATATTNAVYVTAAAGAATATPLKKRGTFGLYLVAADPSVAWSSGNQSPAANGTQVLESESWLDGGTPSSLLIKPLAGMMFPATVGAKAMAMSPTGVYALITNAGLVLFDRATGQQVCLAERFPGAASYVALAAGENGSLYVVSGNRSASGSSVVGGSLTRYDVDGGCPALMDPGTAIDSNGDVVLVAADDTSVY